MSSSHTLHIGLFGANGHQLRPGLSGNTRVVALAGLPGEGLDPSIRAYDSLDELIADPDVEPVKIIRAWSKPPCAFSAAKLDEILAAAAASGRAFREMAADPSSLVAPIQAIRRLVDDGTLGTIVHVQAHKSYPWHDRRPPDQAVDVADSQASNRRA